jgi:DNA polymerase III delta subunit
VAGPERVLVEDVVDATRNTVNAQPFDSVVLTAGDDSAAEIWAALNAYPSNPDARRLVVVRSANLLESVEPLVSWAMAARHRLPTTYAVFVSDSPDIPGGWLKSIRRLTYVVKCAFPNENDLLAWAQTFVPTLGHIDLAALVDRAGGSLRAIHDVLRKVALLCQPPSFELLVSLVGDAVVTDFVESLLALRKPQAFAAAEAVDSSEWPRLLGLLDSRLDVLSMLYADRRTREVTPWLAQRYNRIAGFYDPSRVRHARDVLERLDDAVHSGAQGAVPEVLVMLW